MGEQNNIDFLEYVSCPRCGDDNSHIVVKGFDRLHKIPGEFSASECSNCGFWFQNPRPNENSLAGLYPSDYLPHQKPNRKNITSGAARFLSGNLGYPSQTPDDEENKRFDWRQLSLLDWVQKWQFRVELTPKFVPDGKLLEVGCASGGRLLALHRLGWQQLSGIELVPSAAKQARAYGFDVVCDQVENALCLFPDNHFDVIISSMVIEHLYNPFEIINMIAKKIKPGGQFIFSTVIRDSLDAKIYREYWSGFDFPRHMVYFQKKDLFKMLQEQFETVELIHQSAPIDFVRPAVSRIEEGNGTLSDKFILNLARSRLAKPIGLLLAWLGVTCRVSVFCYRKT